MLAITIGSHNYKAHFATSKFVLDMGYTLLPGAVPPQAAEMVPPCGGEWMRRARDHFWTTCPEVPHPSR
jgi:hypothetical protein